MTARWLRWFFRSPDPGTGGGKPRPRLYVISAPSGAGKTSLVKAVLAAHPSLRVSVSYTTRPRREKEVDGVDYYFVDLPTFERMEADGQFLESALVFGNRYGTARQTVEKFITAGHNVLLEIDWQGARQVRTAMPDCRSIFILPPSRYELERRLRARSTDSDAEIARRLAESVADMGHWDEFDDVVVNDDFNRAAAELAAIVTAGSEASRADRPELGPLLADLLA